ncbi:MAG: DUF4198 domain-containing protein [Pseudomonadota bacterium]
MLHTPRFRSLVGLIVASAVCLTPSPWSVKAHEVWIEPERFSLITGSIAKADIKNGEKFSGLALYYNPESTARLERHSRDGLATLDGRLGDTPAITTRPLRDGLHVLVYQSKPTDIFYAEFEKFARFAEEKGFAEVAARHAARGLPRDGFREVYARFAKALFAVGPGLGFDEPLGLETEIVALDNPYALTGNSMRVAVTYQRKPRAHARLTVFARNGDGDVSVSTVKTDAAGLAVVPVSPGSTYLLDAVVLRAPDAALAKSSRAVWETLWASLTFQIPAR